MKKNLLLAALSCVLLLFVACEKDEIKDVTLSYEVNLPLDINYARVYQAIDSAAIVDAFNLSYDDFMDKLGVNDTSVVHYYALNPDGSINEAKPTATGFGHWFDADGETTTWAKNAVLFSEFTGHFGFEIGQYPNATAVGNKFTIKQGFQYQGALATLIFNIKITEAAE